MCVCAAEAGDLEAFRRTLGRLEQSEDQAEAIAFGAAALVAFTDQAGSSVPRMRGLELSSAASELIGESLQAARAITRTADRDSALWQIVPAASLARSNEVALVAGRMIKDPEARREASEALLGWPQEECDHSSN
jgi:hypothetical protein